MLNTFEADEGIDGCAGFSLLLVDVCANKLLVLCLGPRVPNILFFFNAMSSFVDYAENMKN